MSTAFKQLNQGWNADPNAPEPKADWHGEDLLLVFRPGFYEPDRLREGPVTGIVFERCSRYRFGTVNDEGWYRGQCRFSQIAPAWGEFYEVSGDLKLNQVDDGWNSRNEASEGLKHFLFYFRDEEFECDAVHWHPIAKQAEQSGGGNSASLRASP